MIDIRLLREDFAGVVSSLARRGVDEGTLRKVVELDEQRRALITEGDELRARQRQLGKAVGAAPKDEKPALIAEAKTVSQRLSELEPEQAAVQSQLDLALAVIPNFAHPDAPDGTTEDDAVEVGSFGTKAN